MEGSESGVVYLCHGDPSALESEIHEITELYGKQFNCISADDDHILVGCEDGAYTLACVSESDKLSQSSASVGEAHGNDLSIQMISDVQFRSLYGKNNRYVGTDVYGKVYSWGTGSHGELGHGITKTFLPQPTKVNYNANFQRVCGGYNHSVAVDDMGAAFAWGENFDRQLGLYSKAKENMCKANCMIEDAVFLPRMLPFSLPPNAVKKIACGPNFTVGVTLDGRVFSWGAGECGQLGTGRCTRKEVPSMVQLSAKDFAAQLAAQNPPNPSEETPENGEEERKESNIGNSIEVAVRGNTQSDYAPIVAVDVACGFAHTIVVDNGGNLFGWGLNKTMQLGVDDTSTKYCPHLIHLHSISALGTALRGQAFRVADAIRCSTSPSTSPFATSPLPASGAPTVSSAVRYSKVFAEGHSSAAVDLQGHLYTWGSNAQRRLVQTMPPPPVQLPDEPKVQIINYIARPKLVAHRKLTGCFVKEFALSKRYSAIFVPTTIHRVFPTSGPKRNFSKLSVIGCGFWNAPCILVKFSSKNNPGYVPPRSCIGSMMDNCTITCKPPKFAETGEYIVSISMDGETFLPKTLEISVYKDVSIVEQFPHLLDLRSVDNPSVALFLKGMSKNPFPLVAQTPSGLTTTGDIIDPVTGEAAVLSPAECGQDGVPVEYCYVKVVIYKFTSVLPEAGENDYGGAAAAAAGGGGGGRGKGPSSPGSMLPRSPSHMSSSAPSSPIRRVASTATAAMNAALYVPQNIALEVVSRCKLQRIDVQKVYPDPKPSGGGEGMGVVSADSHDDYASFEERDAAEARAAAMAAAREKAPDAVVVVDDIDLSDLKMRAAKAAGEIGSLHGCLFELRCMVSLNGSDFSTLATSGSGRGGGFGAALNASILSAGGGGPPEPAMSSSTAGAGANPSAADANTTAAMTVLHSAHATGVAPCCFPLSAVVGDLNQQTIASRPSSRQQHGNRAAAAAANAAAAAAAELSALSTSSVANAIVHVLGESFVPLSKLPAGSKLEAIIYTYPPSATSAAAAGSGVGAGAVVGDPESNEPSSEDRFEVSLPLYCPSFADAQFNLTAAVFRDLIGVMQEHAAAAVAAAAAPIDKRSKSSAPGFAGATDDGIINLKALPGTFSFHLLLKLTLPPLSASMCAPFFDVVGLDKSIAFEGLGVGGDSGGEGMEDEETEIYLLDAPVALSVYRDAKIALQPNIVRRLPPAARAAAEEAEEAARRAKARISSEDQEDDYDEYDEDIRSEFARSHSEDEGAAMGDENGAKKIGRKSTLITIYTTLKSGFAFQSPDLVLKAMFPDPVSIGEGLGTTRLPQLIFQSEEDGLTMIPIDEAPASVMAGNSSSQVVEAEGSTGTLGAEVDLSDPAAVALPAELSLAQSSVDILVPQKYKIVLELLPLEEYFLDVKAVPDSPPSPPPSGRLDGEGEEVSPAPAEPKMLKELAMMVERMQVAIMLDGVTLPSEEFWETVYFVEDTAQYTLLPAAPPKGGFTEGSTITLALDRYCPPSVDITGTLGLAAAARYGKNAGGGGGGKSGKKSPPAPKSLCKVRIRGADPDHSLVLDASMSDVSTAISALPPSAVLPASAAASAVNSTDAPAGSSGASLSSQEANPSIDVCHIVFVVPEAAKLVEAQVAPVMQGKEKRFHVDVSIDGGVTFDCADSPRLQLK